MAFANGWEILWPLILGFALSAFVHAVVTHREIARLLPDDRPSRSRQRSRSERLHPRAPKRPWRSHGSLFRNGTNFTAAMAFEMASTNLVVEHSTIMLVFLGWRFMLAEIVGAPIMRSWW